MHPNSQTLSHSRTTGALTDSQSTLNSNLRQIATAGTSGSDLVFDVKDFDCRAVPELVLTSPGAMRFPHERLFHYIATLSRADAIAWERGELDDARLQEIFDWLQWIARSKAGRREW